MNILAVVLLEAYNCWFPWYNAVLGERWEFEAVEWIGESWRLCLLEQAEVRSSATQMPVKAQPRFIVEKPTMLEMKIISYNVGMLSSMFRFIEYIKTTFGKWRWYAEES